MLGVLLIILSVTLSSIIDIYTYYTTLKIRVNAYSILFENNEILISRQNMPIKYILKKYLTIKNFKILEDILITNLKVTNKKTKNTWTYYLKYNQECYIKIPNSVQLHLKGTSIKEISYTKGVNKYV